MKIKALILGFTMLLSMASAYAQGIEVDGIYYIFSDTTAEVTEHPSSGYAGDIIVPSTVTYNGINYDVTSIGNYAFFECTHLISVTISDGVTRIGWSAFADCFFLTSVTIPYGITTIESGTFMNCAFLTSITIPNSVTSIEHLAFYCCGLTSITIPNSVTSVEGGGGAFIGCRGLMSINVESENAYYSSDNGILFNKNKTTLVCYPAGKTGNSYAISSNITTIGASAFACSMLSLIDIPISVTNIKGGAFFACSELTSIDIPSNITTIEYSTFEYCSNLTSISLPKSVTNIGNRAFSECWNLTSIDIPDGVTTIEEFAFFHSGLTSIIIPDGVTSISHATFTDCSRLTSVVIPSSVSSIGWHAFGGCVALTSITNFNPVPVAIDPDAFAWIDQSACMLKVPAGSVSAYKNAEVWKEFNIEGIGMDIESVEISVAKLYPNPTTGKVYLETASNIKVYDIRGALLTETFDNQVDLSSYPQGIYFLQIGDKAVKVIKK